MPTKTLRAHEFEQKHLKTEQNSSVEVLAIGDLNEWIQQGYSLPNDRMAFLHIDDMSEAMLADYNPKVVYSPVLAKNFDCIDLSMLLHSLGYNGPYRAIGQGLPKPEVIEREVRGLCPRLDFAIVPTH